MPTLPRPAVPPLATGRGCRSLRFGRYWGLDVKMEAKIGSILRCGQVLSYAFYGPAPSPVAPMRGAAVDALAPPRRCDLALTASMAANVLSGAARRC